MFLFFADELFDKPIGQHVSSFPKALRLLSCGCVLAVIRGRTPSCAASLRPSGTWSYRGREPARLPAEEANEIMNQKLLQYQSFYLFAYKDLRRYSRERALQKNKNSIIRICSHPPDISTNIIWQGLISRPFKTILGPISDSGNLLYRCVAGLPCTSVRMFAIVSSFFVEFGEG